MMLRGRCSAYFAMFRLENLCDAIPLGWVQAAVQQCLKGNQTPLLPEALQEGSSIGQ